MKKYKNKLKLHSGKNEGQKIQVKVWLSSIPFRLPVLNRHIFEIWLPIENIFTRWALLFWDETFEPLVLKNISRLSRVNFSSSCLEKSRKRVTVTTRWRGQVPEKVMVTCCDECLIIVTWQALKQNRNTSLCKQTQWVCQGLLWSVLCQRFLYLSLWSVCCVCLTKVTAVQGVRVLTGCAVRLTHENLLSNMSKDRAAPPPPDTSEWGQCVTGCYTNRKVMKGQNTSLYIVQLSHTLTLLSLRGHSLIYWITLDQGRHLSTVHTHYDVH